MKNELDKSFKRWLGGISKDWKTPVDQVANDLGYLEIENRVRQYPLLRECLSKSPVDVRKVQSAANACWAVGHRIEQIRLGKFLANLAARPTLGELISDFPDDDIAAAARIDAFVAAAVGMGFSTPIGGSDRAGATLFASLILTALHPDRFVDYRYGRWVSLANELNVESPGAGTSHGKCLV